MLSTCKRFSLFDKKIVKMHSDYMFVVFILIRNCSTSVEIYLWNIFINPPTCTRTCTCMYFYWTLVAFVVKTSQLTVLTVDPNVHTGAFLTGFYCHFDHPEQYQTMLLTSQKWLTDFDL